MSPRVIITCAGPAVRWGKGQDTPKQLALVDGIPVLDRTIRQCIDRGAKPIVVANAPIFEREGAELFKPADSRCWCDTALATESLWQGQTVMIFGDVFFTEPAIDECLSLTGLRAFGRVKPSVLTGGPSEIFGISWGERDNSTVKAALQAGKAHSDADPGKKYDSIGTPMGSPWQPYRHLIGCNLEDHKVDKEMWVERNDWTDDFDTPERYTEWVYRYERRFVRGRVTK